MRTAIFELVFLGLFLPSSVLAIASENYQLTESDQATFGQGEKQLQSEQYVLSVEGPLKIRSQGNQYELNSDGETVSQASEPPVKTVTVPSITSELPVVKSQEKVQQANPLAGQLGFSIERAGVTNIFRLMLMILIGLVFSLALTNYFRTKKQPGYKV